MSLSKPKNNNNALPADVLNEIFPYCIPLDPLKYAQPNIKQAPMLLRHVCSFWRDVAFDNPFLWTHLHHAAYLKDPIWPFDARDIEFLSWWIAKVGELVPSLRMAFKKDDKEGQIRIDQSTAGSSDLSDFVQLLLAFMTKAQYLNLDFHCRLLLQELCGDDRLSPQNLNTLIIRQGYEHNEPLSPHSAEVFESAKSITFTLRQSFRQLFLEDIVIPIRNAPLILNWSRLTHIHAKITLTRDGWFSLLRACDNLEYGLFNIVLTDIHDVESIFHPTKTLPRLKQLAFENNGGNLMQSFLYSIHLPALVGLRINNFMPPCIERLHTILSSTPALRELHLGVAYTAHHPNSILIPGDLEVVPVPLRSVVPELCAIHFEGSDCMLNICTHDRDVVKSVFTGSWLQLGHPGNLLRRVHLGVSWGKNPIEVVMPVVRDLRSSMPEGVTLMLRPYTMPWLWKRWEHRYAHFTEEFEDLCFDEEILGEGRFGLEDGGD